MFSIIDPTSNPSSSSLPYPRIGRCKTVSSLTFIVYVRLSRKNVCFFTFTYNLTQLSYFRRLVHITSSTVNMWNFFIPFFFFFFFFYLSVEATTPPSNHKYNDRVGWVTSPNQRGTADIIWTCLLTILACSWTILHLNIPANTNGWLRKALGKLA